MDIHHVGLILLSIVLVVAGLGYKKANPTTAMAIGFVSGAALVVWTVLSGRAPLVEFVSLEHAHRFTAYLLVCYSVVIASLILLVLKRVCKRA